MKQGGVYRNREHRIKIWKKSNCMKLLLYLENRVMAEKVLILAIDVIQSVSSPGLVSVFCSRQEDGKGGC